MDALQIEQLIVGGFLPRVPKAFIVSDRVSFLGALASARKGEKIVYHRGSLAYDRVAGLGARAMEVSAVADAAAEAYMTSRVHLVQRRTGRLLTETECGKVHEFDYIAVKR